MMKLLVLSCLAVASNVAVASNAVLDLLNIYGVLEHTTATLKFADMARKQKIPVFSDSDHPTKPNWMERFELTTNGGKGYTPLAKAMKLGKWEAVDTLVKGFLSRKGKLTPEVFFNGITSAKDAKSHFEFAMDLDKFPEFVENIIPATASANQFDKITDVQVLELFDHAIKKNRKVKTFEAIQKLAQLSGANIENEYVKRVVNFQVKNDDDDKILTALITDYDFNAHGAPQKFNKFTQASAVGFTECSLHREGHCKKDVQNCNYHFQQLIGNKKVSDANVIAIFKKLSPAAKIKETKGKDLLTFAMITKPTRQAFVDALIAANVFNLKTDKYLNEAIGTSDTGAGKEIIEKLAKATTGSLLPAFKKAIKNQNVDATEILVELVDHQQAKKHITELANNEESYLKNQVIINHVIDKNMLNLKSKLSLLPHIQTVATLLQTLSDSKHDSKHCQANEPWKQTAAGAMDTKKCPKGSKVPKAMQTRKCNSEGKWEDADLTKCNGAFFNGLSIAILALVTVFSM